ncbi:MAG: flavodoxin family protein [Bacteroidales bacterium]|nr:flavodoxin family protein [Bacteroidales bacterium]
MKIVVLTGSSRKKGNSNYLAEQFIKGAKDSGHEVFAFDCAKQKFSPCLACDHCGINGDCAIKDDFTLILRPQIEQANMVVFASPIYYFGLSAQLKMAIDRFYALNSKMYSKKSALLVAMADTADATGSYAVDYYKALVGYLKWKDEGIIVAKGLWNAGAVVGTSYAEKSYSLGRNI